MLLIPATWEERQKDYKFKVSLGTFVSSWLRNRNSKRKKRCSSVIEHWPAYMRLRVQSPTSKKKNQLQNKMFRTRLTCEKGRVEDQDVRTDWDQIRGLQTFFKGFNSKYFRFCSPGSKIQSIKYLCSCLKFNHLKMEKPSLAGRHHPTVGWFSPWSPVSCAWTRPWMNCLCLRVGRGFQSSGRATCVWQFFLCLASFQRFKITLGEQLESVPHLSSGLRFCFYSLQDWLTPKACFLLPCFQ